MKRYLTTIIVGAVFAGLLAWVFTQERGRVTEKGEIFRLQLTDISQMRVETPAHRYTLVREGQDWKFTEPFAGLADRDRVESLLRAVAGLRPEERTGHNLSDPDFGLQVPIVTVTMQYAGNRSAVIRLGEQAPLGSKYFATISVRPASLFLVDQSFKVSLDQDPGELREKRLTRLQVDKFSRIDIRRGEELVTAQRVPLAGEPTWAISAPRQLRADGMAVDTVARALQSTQAVDFLEYTRENLEATGLSQPTLTLTASGQNEPAFTVYLGKQEQRKVPQAHTEEETEQEVVYATRTGRAEIMIFPVSLLMDLNKGLLDLRDKRILDVKQEDIQSLTVQRTQGLSFKAVKSGEEWQLLAPRTGRGHVDKLESILFSLADLQAMDYEAESDPRADLSKYGLKAPQIALIMGVRGRAEITVSIGDEVPDRTGYYYARTSLSNDVYMIADTLVRDLPFTVEDLLYSPGSYSPPPEWPGEYPGMDPGYPMPPG